MSSEIGVGIIGFGFSAKTFHLPFLEAIPSYRIKKIYTTQVPPSLSKTGIEFTPQLDDLWEDPGISVILICSPNDLHFEQALKALSCGKHVVVEKPFVLEEHEGKTLLTLAQKQKKVLTVFHNRRWDSDFLTLQKLVNEKTLGDIYFLEARYDRFRPDVKNRWKENDRPGSGILWDLGAHLIDQALVLFGSPIEVFAEFARQRPSAQTVDYFRVLFSYPTGLKVSLGGSNLCLSPGPKFILHGTKGSFIKFGCDPQEALLREEGFTSSSEWGQEQSSTYGTLTVLDHQGLPKTSLLASEKGAYQTFYESLAPCLIHALPPPIDPADSLDVTRLINLCYQSALEKRTLSV